MDIKEVALRVGAQGLPIEGTAHKFRVLDFCSKEVLIDFAEALLESYKAELLKEAGEPVAYFTDFGGERRYSEKPHEIHEIGLTLKFDGVVYKADDYWEKLYTSDQAAAAVVKATKPLEDAVERLKTVPMKYRRMAFNAQLQDENNELRAQLAAAQEEIELLKGSHERSVNLRDQLAPAELRVADTCANGSCDN